MKCPYCGSDNTKVIDSRSYSDGNSIKRRRECEECQKRFTTHEKVVDLTLFVIKKKGEKQLYSREEILDKLEREILTNFSGEIKSSQLGDKIVSYLLDLDEVAYVRFASVYKKFDNLDSFVKEIEKIKNEKNIKGKVK